MAVEIFDRVMPRVFAHEGGYVDHPKDPGGATKYGITHKTLSAWRGKPVTKADVRALTKQEATAIYRAQYWAPIRGDELPAGLDYALFDFGINSGPARAVKTLQKIVGVPADGIMGAITLDAVSKRSPADLINALCDARLAFLRSLKGWSTFGKGWGRRVAEVRAEALALASGCAAAMVPTLYEAPTERGEAQEPAIWNKPETLAYAATGIGSLSSVFAGSGPLQWALAAAVLIAAGVGAYYAIQRIREAYQ